MAAKKYLLVWDRMGDYHVARWRALQQQLGAAQVLAADLAGADNLYGWIPAWQDDPHYRRLSDTPAQQPDVQARFAAFARIVRQEGITHLALAGYGRAEYVLMALWARMQGCRVTLFAESWYPASSKLKDVLKGMLVSALAHTYLVSGVRAHRHFTHRLGISAHRLAIGYSVVDNAHFAAGAGLPKSKTVLCVARFAPEKNLERLVDAFAQSTLPDLGYTLKLVGGGPLRPQLEALAQRYHWLQLHNWLSYAELPALYGSAQCFILPSLFEPWGLVVNEALAAGLPVGTSQAVGALPDLLGDDTPLQFSATDTAGMVRVLEQLIEAPTPPDPRINRFTPDTWATALLGLA